MSAGNATGAAMPPARSPMRYVATETCIAIAINLTICACATLLVSSLSGLPHATFRDAIGQLFMPTLGPATALIPGITGVTRRRAARGAAPLLHMPVLAWLPRNIVVRTALLAVAALALLALPGAVLLHHYLIAAPVTLARLMAFMLAYAATFALALSPVTVMAALAERPAQ